MISFDIADMYPSLPKVDVINEIIRRIKDPLFKTKIDKQLLIRLSKLVLNFTTFEINNKFYKQLDGLFIGSPASPIFAELYIQKLEEDYIYKLNHLPRVWLRKVDDTFTITKYSIQDTLKELNNINNKVRFTAEEEENRTIPFLDCSISREATGDLIMKVYRKITHTGQYINYNSNQPMSVKLSALRSLTKRAKIICTQEKDLAEELNYIAKTMELNDFPVPLINRTIKQTLNNISKTSNGKIKEDDNRISLFLPYEKNISEEINRISRKFNVKVINTKNKSLANAVNARAIIDKKLQEQGVVYEIKCNDCNMKYIGETGRELSVRINEHKKGGTKTIDSNVSGLSQHIRNTKHEINWNDANVIDKENNMVKRKLKEAIKIRNSPQASLMNKKEECKILSNIWDSIL